MATGKTAGRWIKVTVDDSTPTARDISAGVKDISPVAVSTGANLTTLISSRACGIPLVITMPFAMTRPFYEAGLGTWPDAFDYKVLRIPVDF